MKTKITDVDFNTWWDMIKLNDVGVLPETFISYQIVNRHNSEMLNINRKIGGVYKDGSWYLKNGGMINYYQR